MGAQLKVVEDPLFAGFYTLNDAARLLGMERSTKIRAWIDGWRSSASEAIVKRDFDGTSVVSFLDLMELRFIEVFRSQGVPLQTLRKAAQRLRADWNVDHPFAMSSTKYLTDRRNIFGQVAEQEGDDATWNIVTGQFEMWATIERTIERNVLFDPNTAVAKLWRPRPDFETVVVDPRVAFGRPSIKGHGVPTEALFRQWKADKGDTARVADWFGVDEAAVEAAVGFEISVTA